MQLPEPRMKPSEIRGHHCHRMLKKQVIIQTVFNVFFCC